MYSWLHCNHNEYLKTVFTAGDEKSAHDKEECFQELVHPTINPFVSTTATL